MDKYRKMAQDEYENSRPTELNNYLQIFFCVSVERRHHRYDAAA